MLAVVEVLRSVLLHLDPHLCPHSRCSAHGCTRCNMRLLLLHAWARLGYGCDAFCRLAVPCSSGHQIFVSHVLHVLVPCYLEQETPPLPGAGAVVIYRPQRTLCFLSVH